MDYDIRTPELAAKTLADMTGIPYAICYTKDARLMVMLMQIICMIF